MSLVGKIAKELEKKGALVLDGICSILPAGCTYWYCQGKDRAKHAKREYPSSSFWLDKVVELKGGLIQF